jgi:hypothetical protein
MYLTSLLLHTFAPAVAWAPPVALPPIVTSALAVARAPAVACALAVTGAPAVLASLLLQEPLQYWRPYCYCHRS